MQAGLKVIDNYIISERKGDVGTKQRGAEAMGQLLSLKQRPDGVFCFNDPTGNGSHELRFGPGCTHSGGSLQSSVAEIFTMTILSAFHFQASTSTAGELGRKLRVVALRILNSKVAPRLETIVLQPELVVRRSTQRRGSRAARLKKRTRGLSSWAI